MSNQSAWAIEEIRSFPNRGRFRSALFDFDGTISLIRQGWQDVMKPYFFEVLKSTPKAEDDAAVMRCIHDFVDLLTGKQTIYQCIALAEEVEERGGKPENPQVYKDEYNRRLLVRIEDRIRGLEEGRLRPADLVVPGSFELLQALRERGLTLYLASGTDEEYVLRESALLGVDTFFNGGIYGAQQDYRLFSKKMIVNKIITTHNLHGGELLGFGDGYVEIENIREAGGFAVGVASDEVQKIGVDQWKRSRLIGAGAGIIIGDYSSTKTLLDYIFAGV